MFYLSIKNHTSNVFPIHRKAQERTFDNCSKIVGCLILGLIVLCNKFQRFPELEHGGEFVLTGVAAKATAGQIANFTILIFKFQLIDLGALHDRMTFGAIETDVTHAAFHVIVVTALGNVIEQLESLREELSELEAQLSDLESREPDDILSARYDRWEARKERLEEQISDLNDEISDLELEYEV